MIIDEVTSKVKDIEHGFTQMKASAEEIFSENSPTECYKIAAKLYNSKLHQVRMVAVFILGFIASQNEDAFIFMHSYVARDSSWQVQEILAQAFDRFCKDIGYKNALPIIKKWLKDENENCRRAVSEGLRIWTSRDYFKQNPEIALKLLATLRNDESEYVRRSAGNAIRDISRKNKELVKEEVENWDLKNKRVEEVYKLASKFIK